MTEEKKKILRVVVVVILGGIIFSFGLYRIQRKVSFTIQNQEIQFNLENMPSLELSDSMKEDWQSILKELEKEEILEEYEE